MSRYLTKRDSPDGLSIPQDEGRHLNGNRQGEARVSSRDDFSFSQTHGVSRDGAHQTLISIAALHGPNSIQAAHELHLRLRMLRSTLSSGAANLLDNALALAAKGKGNRKGGKGQQEFLIVKMNDIIITGV